MLVNAALLFAYFFFGKTNNTQAAQIANSVSGMWNATSTWAVGRVPASNDTITILPGNTVTITSSTTEYSNMKIIVQGTLKLNGNKKLLLCNSLIDIQAGASIVGANTGSEVIICGTSAWNGAMPGNGPMQIGATVLPVVLSSFNAESASNGTVNIAWETASEVNCDYFSVERSMDGNNFEVISSVKGAGNTSTSSKYSYIDDNPHSPVSYYRLKQVDFDGKFEIFKVVSVNLNPIREIVVYPNPVATGESATLQIPAEHEKTLQVSVMDAHGKKIFSQIIEKENASDDIFHFVTEKFPTSGTYFITAAGETNKYLKKIIVL